MDRKGPQMPSDKPRGFWVSDDDCERSWARWCESEQFHPDHLRYRQEIILSPDADILHLRNAADLDVFTQQYGAELYPGSRREWIDWRIVCARHQGIVITPYVYERRLDGNCFWYYSWDCASGCIWDARAIARLEMMIYVEQEGTEAV